MPILQAFYTKFYIPEKDMYPAEVENTDKLARAFVVGFYTYFTIAFDITWFRVLKDYLIIFQGKKIKILKQVPLRQR